MDALTEDEAAEVAVVDNLNFAAETIWWNTQTP
jgi:hypothetical protein